MSAQALSLVARICLVILFPFSGVDKIVHWATAMKQANSSPLGGGRYLLVGAIVIELLTPICIVFGVAQVAAALVLAAFSVATAVLFHPFWKFRGFWSGSNPEGSAHFWDFLKNFGLVGGLLLVVAASTARPVTDPDAPIRVTPSPTTATRPLLNPSAAPLVRRPHG